jgi:hypothetical protein
MLRFFIFTLGLSAFFFSCENEPAESMDNETEILFRSQLDTYAATIRSELSNFESDEIKRLAEQDFYQARKPGALPPEDTTEYKGFLGRNRKTFTGNFIAKLFEESGRINRISGRGLSRSNTV